MDRAGPQVKKTPKRALGDRAEAFVEAEYAARGFRCVARNWSCRSGELDLVLERPDLLVFAEVRSVSTRWLSRPSASVTPAKQLRVAKAADAFIRSRAEPTSGIRFDVVGVVHRPSGMTAHVIENAFVPPWAF